MITRVDSLGFCQVFQYFYSPRILRCLNSFLLLFGLAESSRLRKVQKIGINKPVSTKLLEQKICRHDSSSSKKKNNFLNLTSLFSKTFTQSRGSTVARFCKYMRC